MVLLKILTIAAQIVAGEAGTCPLPARIAVADVIAHRYPVYGTAGWYGRARPEAVDIKAVKMATRIDMVPGAMYVFSDSDMHKLHISAREDYTATCSTGNLHFYKQWPILGLTGAANGQDQQYKKRDAEVGHGRGRMAYGVKTVAAESANRAHPEHGGAEPKAMDSDVLARARLARYGDWGIYGVGGAGDHSRGSRSFTYKTFVPLVAGSVKACSYYVYP